MTVGESSNGWRSARSTNGYFIDPFANVARRYPKTRIRVSAEGLPKLNDGFVLYRRRHSWSSSSYKREDMIDGVKTKILKVIPDERGYLMEILRCDEDLLRQFGQVYMTTAYPGVVKGWHYHNKQDDNFAVVKGMIKLVLYDRRTDSPTHAEVNEFFIGVQRPMLIHIAHGIAHGFKGVGVEEAIIVNTVTEAYDYKNPDAFRIDPHGGEIPYDWSRKDG